MSRSVHGLADAERAYARCTQRGFKPSVLFAIPYQPLVDGTMYLYVGVTYHTTRYTALQGARDVVYAYLFEEGVLARVVWGTLSPCHSIDGPACAEHFISGLSDDAYWDDDMPPEERDAAEQRSHTLCGVLCDLGLVDEDGNLLDDEDDCDDDDSVADDSVADAFKAAREARYPVVYRKILQPTVACAALGLLSDGLRDAADADIQLVVSSSPPTEAG